MFLVYSGKQGQWQIWEADYRVITPEQTKQPRSKKPDSVQPSLYETVAVHEEVGLNWNPVFSGHLNQ